MLKIVFWFIFMIVSTFSKEELEIQIKKTEYRKIEIFLTKNLKDNETKIQVYKIKSGDTLSALSLKFNNTIEELIELNNIKNKDLIIINKKLRYIEKKEKINEI